MSCLKYCTRGIYKSSVNIDNKEVVYAISIAKHVYEERYISPKKSQSRLFEEFDIKKFNHIVQPLIKHMIDKPGKYVIRLPYRENSEQMLYLLIAFEESIKIKGEWFIVLVTTFKDSSKNVKFLRIPTENRLMSRCYYYDLLVNKNF